MIAEPELDKGLRTLKLIWFAMLVSLTIYLFIGLYVGPDLQPSTSRETLDLFRPILYGFAFITLILSRYIRRMIMSGKGRREPPGQVPPQSVFQRYSTATVIAFAMSESIGIYGLLLFFLGKNQTDLYLLLLLSAAALWICRPRKDNLMNLLRESQKDIAAGGAGG